MKIAFICFDFKPSNLRKQPWRYVSELTSIGDDSSDTCIVISDTDEDSPDVDLRTVDRLYSISGPSAELVNTIETESPDVVVSLLGPSSFIRSSSLASELDIATIGIMSSPLYNLSDIVGIGTRELLKHPEYLASHFVGAVTPRRRIAGKLDDFDTVITLTDETRHALVDTGTMTTIKTVRPGIDEFDLALPPEEQVSEIRSEFSPDNPMILYFTSPLTLRGTDTLVRAVSDILDHHHDATLVILSRQDDGGLGSEESYLLHLAEKLGIRDSVQLVPRNLSPQGVKAFLRASDVIALPYKIVISGVPISILESMAMGRPVVTTRTGGLNELVCDERQLSEPNNAASLAGALSYFIRDNQARITTGQRNRQRMKSSNRWDSARTEFAAVLKEVK